MKCQYLIQIAMSIQVISPGIKQKLMIFEFEIKYIKYIDPKIINVNGSEINYFNLLITAIYCDIELVCERNLPSIITYDCFHE